MINFILSSKTRFVLAAVGVGCGLVASVVSLALILTRLGIVLP